MFNGTWELMGKRSECGIFSLRITSILIEKKMNVMNIRKDSTLSVPFPWTIQNYNKQNTQTHFKVPFKIFHCVRLYVPQSMYSITFLVLKSLGNTCVLQVPVTLYTVENPSNKMSVRQGVNSYKALPWLGC